MSKIKKLIGVVLCALVLTGCEIKYEGQVEITKDGKMDMSVIMAYDRDLISTLIYMEENDDLLENESGLDDIPEASITKIRTYLEDNKPEEQDGMEVSRYEKNGYYGYQVSYEIDNIDNVSSKNDVEYFLFGDFETQNNEDNTSNSKNKMMFKKENDVYYANYKIEDSSNSNLNSNLSMIDIALSYTVTLPTKPISHNADTVSEDGKTLSWNISGVNGTKDSIEYSFKLKDTVTSAATNDGLNTEMIMLIAGIVIIVIIIIIVLILFARNNKKLDKKLDAIDQTIPSAAPKPSTPVVENNNAPIVNAVPTPIENNTSETPVAEQTPVVESTPTETVSQPEVQNTSPIQIEAVPVVESIPVNNNQINENTTIETTPVAEQTEVVTPIAEKPSLEEMPVIMEPSVMPIMQNTQEVQTQPETVLPTEPTVQTENNIEQETINNTLNAEENKETPNTDNNVTENTSNTIVETPMSSVVEQPITPQTQVVEDVVQVSEPLVEEVANVETKPEETQVAESNIFDTQEQPAETNIAPSIEPVLNEQQPEPVSTETIAEPVVESQVINETPFVEVLPNDEANKVEEVTVINEVPTANENIEIINNTENTPVVEENQVIETQTVSEPIETLTIEQSSDPVEEVKLEVLENNTSLDEPDIPLPEPVVETPVVEVTLEETPTPEPTGNRFIRTDFIENNQEELPKDNNTNM